MHIYIPTDTKLKKKYDNVSVPEKGINTISDNKQRFLLFPARVVSGTSRHVSLSSPAGVAGSGRVQCMTASRAGASARVILPLNRQHFLSLSIFWESAVSNYALPYHSPSYATSFSLCRAFRMHVSALSRGGMLILIADFYRL